MSESKESRLQKRINELEDKLQLYRDLMKYIETRLACEWHSTTKEQPAEKILNQLLSQENQIVRSLAWHQKALQELWNKQPRPSQ
jgi:adenylosuccinate synthase